MGFFSTVSVSSMLDQPFGCSLLSSSCGDNPNEQPDSMLQNRSSSTDAPNNQPASNRSGSADKPHDPPASSGSSSRACSDDPHDLPDSNEDVLNSVVNGLQCFGSEADGDVADAGSSVTQPAATLAGSGLSGADGIVGRCLTFSLQLDRNATDSKHMGSVKLSCRAGVI
jgi:hypothetical protein